MKIYVVEFGEYSDRSITGVYSTHERAEVAATPDGYVTEYELDAAFDLYDKGLRAFNVEMHYDGSVVKVTNYGYWSEVKAHVGMASTDNFIDSHSLPFRWNCIRVTTWARNGEHAIKIANEHRAEFIAAGWNGVDHFDPTKTYA